MKINIKRAYQQAAPEDGFRVLVDRLWPRGVRKEWARIDLWLKEAGPSKDLRKWFNHDPARWEQFKKRYFDEIDGKKNILEPIREQARKRPVTLVFGSKEEKYNNAVALKEYLMGKRSP